MNNLLLPIAGIMLLSACASTQEILSKEADETQRSSKSQTEVAFCLANKNNVPALDAPDGAKLIQVKNSVGAVGMAFSVYAEGSGSRTEVRRVIPSVASWRNCL